MQIKLIKMTCLILQNRLIELDKVDILDEGQTLCISFDRMIIWHYLDRDYINIRIDHESNIPIIKLFLGYNGNSYSDIIKREFKWLWNEKTLSEFSKNDIEMIEKHTLNYSLLWFREEL